MTRLLMLITLFFATAGLAATPVFGSEDPTDTLHAAEAELEEIAHSAVDGHDEHGDHAKPGVIAKPKEGAATAVTALVVFVLVMGILSTVVWPKISQGLAERNSKIQGEIAAAEEARRQAKDALDEYERNLAEARAESQKMLEDTRAQQTALAAQLKSQADTELTAMRDKARNEIETAKKQALAEIYAESVNLASVMAGKILQREVTVDDQQRLMDESLAEMKAVNA